MKAMTEKPVPPEHCIRDCLDIRYGIKCDKLTMLPGGADMNASVYRAHAPDGSSYFVKVKQDYNPSVSITVLKLLHTAGISEIILPLPSRHGQLYHVINNCTLLVSPFIEGHNGFSHPLTNRQWIQLGAAMNRIHGTTISSSVQAAVRYERYLPKWRNAFRLLLTRIDSEPAGDDITVQTVLFMKTNEMVLQRIVDQAEQLAQKIQALSPEFVLCHSDIHGGNVLMAADESVFIVDWDDPMMAPKERDLMFFGGGVGNVWNKQHEEELFYRGYGEVNADRTILAYYRFERIVEDTVLFAEEALLGADDQSRIDSYNFLIAQFDREGVVDKAFGTIGEIGNHGGQ